YLKGQPKLGFWYPKDSPFNLVAYTDSDYAGASLDRKSTIRGCQFLGCRLISWQCKKQTVDANSTIKAEYVVASSCCRQIYLQKVLMLVPSCFVIFDLEPLSLSFEFIFTSEILKSISFSLDRLCHLAILCLDQHAHTLHLLESLLTISLDRLDILKEDLFEHEHVGFTAALAVLITEASQSRQHGLPLDPSWSCFSDSFNCDMWAKKLGMQDVGVIRVRMDMGDKEVTKQDLVAKVVMEVLGRLLDDMVVMSWRCLRS
ncbi:hypothetical protein Tco_0724558, partial [Tanacetum coccineum]